MIKVSRDLVEILKEDKEKLKEYIYKDEAIISNLFYVSLSTSLKELAAIKKVNEEEFEKRSLENEWLRKGAKESEKISTINFDKISRILGIEGTQSADAFFYSNKKETIEEKRLFNKNLLIEFKNCNKSEMFEIYLNRQHKDFILSKFRNSKTILENLYIGDENLLNNTHVIIVYNGKNDVVSPPTFLPIKKSKVNNKYEDKLYDKQKRAVRVSFIEKNFSKDDYFGKEIERIGFVACHKEDFPIPAVIKFYKDKKDGKKRKYTLFSGEDFIRLIKEGYFTHWDWGSCSEYIS